MSAWEFEWRELKGEALQPYTVEDSEGYRDNNSSVTVTYEPMSSKVELSVDFVKATVDLRRFRESQTAVNHAIAAQQLRARILVSFQQCSDPLQLRSGFFQRTRAFYEGVAAGNCLNADLTSKCTWDN